MDDLNITIHGIDKMTYLLLIIKRIVMNFFLFSLIKFLSYFIICISIFVIILLVYFKKQINEKIAKNKINDFVDLLLGSNLLSCIIATLTVIVVMSTSPCIVISEDTIITTQMIFVNITSLLLEIMMIYFLYKLFKKLLHLEVFDLINNSLIECSYLSNNEKIRYNKVDKFFFKIFLILITFVLCLSIDKAFLVTKISSEQYKFIRCIFERDNLFILNKIIFRMGSNEKEMLFSAIIQLSSLFITFVGFIISFINQTIYSINVHMIICWKCNAFKMIYHRMATLVIFVLSFFILNSNYLLSIIFLDVYLLWIIIYNIYLVSSICLHITFDNVIAKKMVDDTDEIYEIIKLVSMEGTIRIAERFSNEYLYYYGKSIFLPMNLLNAHRENNREEYYQLSCQCLSEYILLINKIILGIQKNKIKNFKWSVYFVLKKWIDSYFVLLKKKNEIDFLELRYISKVLDILSSISNDFIRNGIIAYFLFNLIQIIDYKKYEEFKHDFSFKNESYINSLMVYFMTLYDDIDGENRKKILRNVYYELLLKIEDCEDLYGYYSLCNFSIKLIKNHTKIYEEYSETVNLILKMKGRKI